MAKNTHLINVGGFDMEVQLQNLKRFPARPIYDLICDIQKIGKLSNLGLDVTIPWTTFHLKSGRDLMGFIIDVYNRDEEKTVLIYYSKKGSVDPNITVLDTSFIPISSIESLTIHDISAVGHLLAMGSIASAIDGTPLGHKQINEKLLKFEYFFKEEFDVKLKIEIKWDDIPEETIKCIHMMDFVRDALLGLFELLRGMDDKSNFTRKITQILFTNGTKVKATILKKTMTLTAPLKQESTSYGVPLDMKKLIDHTLNSNK